MPKQSQGVCCSRMLHKMSTIKSFPPQTAHKVFEPIRCSFLRKIRLSKSVVSTPRWNIQGSPPLNKRALLCHSPNIAGDCERREPACLAGKKNMKKTKSSMIFPAAGWLGILMICINMMSVFAMGTYCFSAHI